MATPSPVLVLFLPLAYIMTSFFILMAFSTVLAGIGQFGIKVKTMRELAVIEPFVTTMVDYLARVFGPLSKFTPQPNMVFMVAILVALVVNGSRRR